MKAKSSIVLPTGVRMGEGVTPFVDREHKAAPCLVTLVHVEKQGTGEIVVHFDIELAVQATFVGDRGKGNPSVAVSVQPVG